MDPSLAQGGVQVQPVPAQGQTNPHHALMCFRHRSPLPALLSVPLQALRNLAMRRGQARLLLPLPAESRLSWLAEDSWWARLPEPRANTLVLLVPLLPEKPAAGGWCNLGHREELWTAMAL